MATPIDVLFIPFFADLDRWHNDGEPYQRPSLARVKATHAALSAEQWMKDEVDVVIDSKLMDFSRFLSWVGHGDTREHERYDPFNMTLLSGSYYLSLLHQQGHSVRILNLGTRRSLAVAADAYDPRFVLLSTTLLFDAVETDLLSGAVACIRAVWPEAVIVLGGLMLTSYEKILPADLFRRKLWDYGADAYVVSPRGETSLLAILARGSREALQADPDIPATYVRGEQALHAPSGVPDPALPLEAGTIRWNALPQSGHLYHTVHLRTARSCAFKCEFCEYPVNQGPLTLMPLETVEAELSALAALGTVRSIIFTDDTFNVPLRRFKDLLRILAKFEFDWYSFFRPQYADAETAQLMRASGCRAVFAGLESVDETVLRNMNKRASADVYQRGLAHLRAEGIGVHANFIVGFPGETEESARQIIRFLDTVGIDFFTVCTWAYIPSTPIGRRTKEFQIEGFGMNWRHQTMTSSDAQCLARAICQEQRYAVHNAVRGEAWMEFMLFANGFTVDEVRLALRAFNRLMERDWPSEAVKRHPDHAALEHILHQRAMPCPAVL